VIKAPKSYHKWDNGVVPLHLFLVQSHGIPQSPFHCWCRLHHGPLHTNLNTENNPRWIWQGKQLVHEAQPVNFKSRAETHDRWSKDLARLYKIINRKCWKFIWGRLDCCWHPKYSICSSWYSILLLGYPPFTLHYNYPSWMKAKRYVVYAAHLDGDAKIRNDGHRNVDAELASVVTRAHSQWACISSKG